MAANSEDFDLVVIKGIALLVLQFIAHNINDILHIITAVLTIGYLLWRWRRDWRKEKLEQTKAHRDGKAIDQKEGN